MKLGSVKREAEKIMKHCLEQRVIILSRQFQIERQTSHGSICKNIDSKTTRACQVAFKDCVEHTEFGVGTGGDIDL